MALFKIPQRKEEDIHKAIQKAREEAEYTPKIKLKGTTLLNKLDVIKQTVEQNLGEYKNNYILITDDSTWLNYCRQVAKDEYVAIDTETTGLEFKDQKNLVGVCIQSSSQKPAYVPVGHMSTITESLVKPQVSKEAITEGIKIIAESPVKVLMHNAYYDLVVIKLNTDIWLDCYWDTLIAGVMLDENESHSLKYLYDKYVMNGEAGVHKFAELFDGLPFCYVPYNVGYLYAGHDAEMTLDLFNFQKDYLTKGTEECTYNHLERVVNVFRDIEMPLVPVLAEMRVRGIEFDFKRAEELKVKYTALRDKAEKSFHKAVEPFKNDIIEYARNYGKIEYPINFNSPVQIKILIYDILKSGVIFKKEPTGTGSHVIDEVLSNKKYANTPLFKIMKSLSEVKKYDKLIGTFIDKLTEVAKESNGKIYFNMNQLGAKTGRLSSSNPKQGWAYVARAVYESYLIRFRQPI